MRHLTSFILAATFAGTLLAGCGGGPAGAPARAGLPLPAAHGTGTASFVVAIPKKAASTTSAAGTRPQYVSPATQSITIVLAGPTAYSATANLTVSSTGCTSSLASTTCTLTIPGLAPGGYTATLRTYDGANGTGNALSAAQAIAFTVAAGQSNTVNLTLSGVPASTLVLPTGSLVTAGSGRNTYNLVGQGAQAFLVVSLDADGSIIVGAGAPTFALGAPSGALTGVSIATPPSSAPNSFSVTPPTAYAAGSASFTVTPAFSGQATNGCAQTGANCSAVTVTVAMVTFLYVANSNNTVTAYNASGTQQTLTGTFPNLSSPPGIAYDPSNGFLYVTNNASLAVTAYNASGARQTLTDIFTVVGIVRGIAYDPSNGFLYVGSLNNTVTAWNASGTQQTLTGTFPNVNGPYGIAYNPSNGFLYVANQGNNTVTAYDASGAQQTLTGTFPNVNNPTGIAIVP